jgi:spore maturation protein CgeB
MSLGKWLYYKRKFKLFVLPFGTSTKQDKTILALTYERNWMVPKGYAVNYFDLNASTTFTRQPDMVIEREYNDGKAEYSYLYNHSLKKIAPKIFWFIDAHVADEKRIRYCDNFDFVFVAQSPYVEKVKKTSRCKNIFWLPLCFPKPANTITANNEISKYVISFIGSYGEAYEKRNKMLSFLQQEYKEKFFLATDYANAKSLIQQSKITTNYSAKDDLNFRVFETLGYGTALVTNYVPDIDKIAGLAEQVYCFRNNQELKKSIDDLLNDNSMLVRKARSAQLWLQQHHTLDNRLAEMLQMINTGKQVEYK